MSERTAPDGVLSPVKQALVEIRRLKAELAAARAAADAVPAPTAQRPQTAEPVAIVGMAFRFPGGLNDADALWQALATGVDAISSVPAERWDETLFDPGPVRPGRSYSRYGGFVTDVDRFDAAFFGITPREAESMDPQQRMLLELTWEALERAAIAPTALAGTDTAVFIGISTSDYGRMLLEARDEIDAYASLGAAESIAAGRIAYTLDLRGPCMAVDTACSSSLAAVHLGCEALRSRKTGLVLAGASSLMLAQDVTVSFSNAGMLARDGRCKTFDAAADGYVRGEGCAVLVLKRLADAEADRDPILAVIRGTATNHDGRSAGLTAPNGPQQEAVIRAALRDGGVAPEAVDYVEAHGTGTRLGDPIEVQALAAAYGRERPGDRPLLVGSVKTNVGHLEAAAGLAGLVKGVLALHNEALPPHRNFADPNPLVDWERLPVAVVDGLRSWPRSDRPRLFGVSSFGFSGSNVHLVVGEAPDDPIPAPRDRDGPALFVMSARTGTALRTLAGRTGEWIAASTASLDAICFAAAIGRAHLAHRLAVVARDRQSLADALRRWSVDGSASGVMTGVAGAQPRLGLFCPAEIAALDGQIAALRIGAPALSARLGGDEASTDHYPADVGSHDLQVALGRALMRAGLDPAICLGSGDGAAAAALLAGRAPAAGESPPAAWAQTFRDMGVGIVLSLGPADGSACAGVRVISLLDREPGQAVDGLLHGLADLYCAGVTPDWRAILGQHPSRRLPLPPTSFERQRFWRPRPAVAPALDWGRLVAALERQSHQGPLGWDLRHLGERTQWMDRLTAGCAAEALLTLGAFAEPGAVVSLDDLMRHHGILPRLRPLLARWLKLLVREGLLMETPAGYGRRDGFVPQDLAEVWRQVDRLLADDAEILGVVRRTSTCLPALLTGRFNPLEVLFVGGSFEVAEGIYGASASARYMNALVGAAVREAMAARRGPGFRLLEVGAGTGGTTGALWETIPHDAEYWFTDVSDAFLTRGRHRFGTHPAFRFARLDLEAAPSVELPIGRCDVVLASNVIHATRNVAATLSYLHSLLKPGGLLIILEATLYYSIFDLTFGFIEGWSAFADAIRKEHPLLSADQWTEMLAANGFATTARFPAAGHAADGLGQHVVIGRRGGDGAGRGAPVTAVRQPTQGGATLDTGEDTPRQAAKVSMDLVRRAAARVMHLDPETQPGPRERFSDLGLDSMMALQLKTELATALGLEDLPATVVLDSGTVEALTEQLLLITAPSERADPAPVPTVVTAHGRLSEAELATHTDDEIAALIARRFQNGAETPGL